MWCCRRCGACCARAAPSCYHHTHLGILNSLDNAGFRASEDARVRNLTGAFAFVATADPAA